MGLISRLHVHVVGSTAMELAVFPAAESLGDGIDVAGLVTFGEAPRRRFIFRDLFHVFAHLSPSRTCGR